VALSIDMRHRIARGKTVYLEFDGLGFMDGDDEHGSWNV
jgi:hypothetical protein